MSDEQKLTAVTYWLDEKNRIDEVSNEAWDDFARSNEGDLLVGGRVLGRPLLDFIAGDTTRMWVHALISYARLLGKQISREYRCDSPNERRFMRMDIMPVEGDRLRVDHWLVRSEPLEAVLEFVTAVDGDSVKAHRCSICNQLEIGGFWVEPHPDVLAHAVPGEAMPVVYTVCPSCQEALRKAPEATHQA